MSPQFEIISLSLKVAALATLIIIPPGIYLGWLFSRKTFWGKSFLDGAVTIPLVLPPVVTGYLLLIFLGPNSAIGSILNNAFGIRIAFTWGAAVLAAAIVSFPLLVRSVRVAMDAVDPKLEEAGRLLRAGNVRVFFRITLPLAANGIIAGAVLAFARALGEFGATIIFAGNIQGQTQTIPLAVFTYFNQPGGAEKAMFLLVISIIISYCSILLNELILRRMKNA